MSSKVYTYLQIEKKATALRHAGKKIVFTNGCFDILHAGHVDYLSKARKSGDFLIVGLNSDQSVRSIKGPLRPINHERDRAKVLSALTAVDAVVLFQEATPLKLIKRVRPHVMIKGKDWKVSEIAGAKEVMNWGGRVKRIDLVKGRSTTNVIDKILKMQGSI